MQLPSDINDTQKILSIDDATLNIFKADFLGNFNDNLKKK